MMKKLLLYLSVFAILVNSGCKGGRALPQSAGRRDDVILIVPDEIKTDSLKKVLEHSEYYPSREEVYRVSEYPPPQLSQYKYWRNIVIVGSLGDTYIDKLLSEESKRSIEEGGGLLYEEDLWVDLQSVAIIAGRDREETQKLVNQYGETIYQLFRDKERERFEKVLYLDDFQRQESEKMEKLLGASFRIPLGYRISKEEEHFMTYIRKSPDRLVTLYYRIESILDPVKFRDSLFALYFEGDSVYAPMTRICEVRFDKIRAYKIEGVWQNMEKVMGGPFISYVFEKDGIWYFLDGHVFVPGKKKWVYLEEVDIILHTFEKGF